MSKEPTRKNLANCKPSEFLRQTNKIKKSVENWLTLTEIMEIRKRKPEYAEGATAEEIEAARQQQIKDNFSDILEAILEKHPDETLEVLALCCFIEPKDADNHSVSEYILSMSDLINDQAVLGFFTSLMRLNRTVTPGA